MIDILLSGLFSIHTPRVPFMLFAATFASISEWTKLHDGTRMPTISLGTCCGSSPEVGLAPWVNAGGIGIDTAIGYRDQPQIAAMLKQIGVARSSVYITSKTAAGCGKVPDCAADPNVTVASIKTSMQQLGVEYIDLMLLHRPCQQLGKACSIDPGAAATQGNCTGPDLIGNPTVANNALWTGMQEAQKQGLVRSIGVSNYNAAELQALQGAVPVVNQCEMSVSGVDKVTLKYCQEHNIVYESFGTLRGCDWTATAVAAAAAAHAVSAAQVCIRWAVSNATMVLEHCAGVSPDSDERETFALECAALFFSSSFFSHAVPSR